MANLYHRVPDNMVGDTLYPLNELKDIHPDVYERERTKREGRERVMEQIIPYLDCWWNEVIHLTAVHPKKIKDALNTNKTFQYYQIDPGRLEPDNTIVYLYNELGPLTKESFTTYDPNKISEYTELPEETKEYYQERQEQGKRQLLFVYIPHILYKGRIDTSDVEVITV
jgi:hypothetical protein